MTRIKMINPLSFIELCVSGVANPNDIDNFIDSWHCGSSKITLAKFLGMTETEYALWVQQPEMLQNIINTHKIKRP